MFLPDVSQSPQRKPAKGVSGISVPVDQTAGFLYAQGIAPQSVAPVLRLRAVRAASPQDVVRSTTGAVELTRSDASSVMVAIEESLGRMGPLTGNRVLSASTDLGVSLSLWLGEKNRENGAIPLRSRRCNRGRTCDYHCESACRIAPPSVAGSRNAGRCRPSFDPGARRPAQSSVLRMSLSRKRRCSHGAHAVPVSRRFGFKLREYSRAFI